MTDDDGRLVLGWEEWVALPSLGLPAIRAKIDTGARTSALDAFLVEPFGGPERPMVRFGVHPAPGRTDIEVFCSAPVIGRREVTSSNGEREWRYVIEAEVCIAGRSWPIEVTLANRETMAYRMLIGRQAIHDDMRVEPRSSFRQPRLSYKLYRHMGRAGVRRPLRLALVTSAPERPSIGRLLRAAGERGHVAEVVCPAAAAVTIEEGRAVLRHAGAELPHFDAVIPRLTPGDGPLALAIVREVELAGALSLVPAAALETLATPIAAMQRLDKARLRLAVPVSDGVITARRRWPEPSHGRAVRLLVIDGRTVGALPPLRSQRAGSSSDPGAGGATEPEACRLAEHAARALDLAIAGVDIAVEPGGPAIARVTAAPALAGLAGISSRAAAALVIVAAERATRPLAGRDRRPRRDRSLPDDPSAL